MYLLEQEKAHIETTFQRSNKPPFASMHSRMRFLKSVKDLLNMSNGILAISYPIFIFPESIDWETCILEDYKPDYAGMARTSSRRLLDPGSLVAIRPGLSSLSTGPGEFHQELHVMHEQNGNWHRLAETTIACSE